MIFPAAKILLATDGSQDAALAARAAVDISSGTGSELHVVHVWPYVPSPHFEQYIRARLEQEARELLAEQVEHIKGGGGDIAEAHLRRGSAVDEIVDLTEELGAGLIVIGSRGLGPVKRLAMGSVSEGVVHHAPCPVLVLRGGEGAWPPNRIVVGDDGSEAARAAGKLAASIGKLFGAKALLVRAYPSLPEIDVEGRQMDARRVDDELRREERKLEERAAEIEAILGTRTEIRIAVGDPAVNLVEAAEEDTIERTLLVVGTRGLGTMKRIRLGSVSTKVLRAVEGPVLIHPRERAQRHV